MLGWTGLTQVHLGEAPPKGDDLEVLQIEGLREDRGSGAWGDDLWQERPGDVEHQGKAFHGPVLTNYFLQDGEPCHKEKLTAEEFQNRPNITLIKWPRNSPDLNPIEKKVELNEESAWQHKLQNIGWVDCWDQEAVKWEDERFKLHKYLGGHTQEAGVCLQAQGGHE